MTNHNSPPHDFKFDIEEAADFLSHLANKQRLLVVDTIKVQEMSVNDLAAVLGLSQSALSQHLKILREAKLVQTRREGHHIYYSEPSSPALRLVEALEKAFGPLKTGG